jgi:hypothetical protein
MYKDWLQKRITIAEAEEANMARTDRLGPDAVPFGFMNREWREFVAKVCEGDELWEFTSPHETWVDLAGREGIAMVREGEIVAFILTSMS